jgi:probable F420-dependent oxidoreductase
MTAGPDGGQGVDVDGAGSTTGTLVERVGAVGVWASQLGLYPAADARAAVAEVEQLGFGTVWVGEAAGKEALTHAGVLLAATTNCAVATGIANIWARDALAMANAARTLAEAYPGRFVLGIGASHAPLVDTRGHDYARPLTAMRAYLDGLDDAPYRGPLPAAPPPRVLAALGPKMLALAADRSDGAHTFFVPVEHTAFAREVLGRDRLLAPEQAVVLAGDRDAARRVADRHLRGYLALPNYTRNLARFGFTEEDVADGGSDRLFDALIAWGDPDDIAARVRAHHDAGADHVAVHVLVPHADDSFLPVLRELGPVVLGS